MSDLGPEISKRSTLHTIQVDAAESVAHVCTCPSFQKIGMEFCGVLAMSRPDFPGEAFKAIRAFREASRIPGAAIYGAWDYNVDRAAGHAIVCGADGILMPGIDENEMFRLLFGIMERVEAGQAAPKSVQEHHALLRSLTTEKSPFWNNQELVKSPYY